jgi:MFS family permease
MIHYPKIERKEKVHFNWRKLFDTKSIITSLNLMIIMSSYGGLLSFVALYGKEIGVSNTSWFFLVFAVGIGSARFGVGRVFDKDGPQKILTVCLLLLIVGFLYLALFKNSFVYYSSGIILGYGIGAVFPTFQAITNNMAPVERRGAANSTLYTALDLGMGAGMIVTGYLGEHFGISVAFALCALLILVGLIFFRSKSMPFYNLHKMA